jgi:glycosyltransferase involved in cell wall biosynthesis
MSNKSFFSIITVTYNREDDLEATIKSVKDQSCKDYEYIVVDGQSTDGTVDVIRQYESSINHWVSEKDKGIYNAMNKGAKAAKGKYLYFLNAGDIFADNEVLTNLKEEIDNEDMVYGKIRFVNWEKNSSYIKNKRLTSFNVKLGNKIGQQGYFVKREVFNRLGGLNERYEIASDFDLICKLFDNNCNVKKTDLLICDYDSSGISSDLKKSYGDTARVIRDRYGVVYYYTYKVVSFGKYLSLSLLKRFGY